MFEKLLKACKGLDKAEASSSNMREDILQLVHDGVTTKDLNEFLSSDIDESDHITVLWAAYAIIKTIGKDVKSGYGRNGDEINDAALGISDRISSIILPICSNDPLDKDKTDYDLLRRKGVLGFMIIQEILKLPHNTPLQFRSSTLLNLAAFTDTRDPWAEPRASDGLQDILSAQTQTLGDAQLRTFIVEDILTGFIRPLFSKSRPAAVTASGRKAEFVEPSRYDTADRDSPETKPWKYARRYAVTVFGWAVLHADTPLLQTHWPLFTPALLTLLDEPQSIGLKVKGIGIFHDFWSRCPPGLMQNTGLASVFEEAIFPAVLYLPSLTPVDESVQILRVAYPALIKMAGLEDSAPQVGPREGQQKQVTEAQRKLLDKIIREGIMVGYHHAKEHARLVRVLCEMLVCIIEGMGILAVKHLKDFIPMACEIMTDPFGPKDLGGLASATILLQSILRNCWPRIPHYCDEVIKILMLCWLNIEDEEWSSDDMTSVNGLKGLLTESADMLSAIMKAAQLDFNERVGPLIKIEPQLSKLFRERNSA
ncbi:hypothetical protein F4804DRAFT_136679 [Jackrogersella minutella]|nr:hypothetical protein F4804DRAFT_136679 [Jackrogersella minutella]